VRSVAEIFRSQAILDEEGNHIGGCDKESNHRFGAAYEGLFPDRAAVRAMLEVGVAGGHSLLAWREVFPNAVCVGMDIVPDAQWLLHAKDRIEFHCGDMRSPADCWRAVGNRKFDLITEDASHKLGDTLAALLYLWPSVRVGGLYVIEDLVNVHGHRWDVTELFPFAEIVDTCGPFIKSEPLVVLRKTL
jgi:hypothetical protein